MENNLTGLSKCGTAFYVLFLKWGPCALGNQFYCKQSEINQKTKPTFIAEISLACILLLVLR